MAVNEFEVVGLEEFKKLVESMRTKVKERLDKVAALEEAATLIEFLNRKGYNPMPVEVDETLPPVYRIELSKARVYLIVYPPRYDLLAGEASKPALYILTELEQLSGKYIVLIYYSRHGKLGPAAYLYLGMLIEEFNIGVLFVNGSENEIAEILDSLERSGKYEPPDDEAVPLQ